MPASGAASATSQPSNKRMGRHCVWVGRVPAALCASEDAVRASFKRFGKLRAVRIHHNLVDMSAHGFMFLEFASKRAAQRAVDAVESGDLELPDGLRPGEMRAAHALERGEPATAEGDGDGGADEDLRALLLGRHTPGAGVQFNSQHDTLEDEDDAMLQSLSQHSFGTQRKRHKRRKVRE